MKKLTKQEKLINNYSNLDLEIIPKHFVKNTFAYELVVRCAGKCIYALKDNGIIIAYEVFKTMIQEYRERMRKLCERVNRIFNENDYRKWKETFPSDEEFGKRAWTYKNLELAKRKYEEM